jgi:hypothetical protein
MSTKLLEGERALITGCASARASSFITIVMPAFEAL